MREFKNRAETLNKRINYKGNNRIEEDRWSPSGSWIDRRVLRSLDKGIPIDGADYLYDRYDEFINKKQKRLNVINARKQWAERKIDRNKK